MKSSTLSINNGTLSEFKYTLDYLLTFEFQAGKIKVEPIVNSIKRISAKSRKTQSIYVSSKDSQRNNDQNSIWYFENEFGKFVLIEPNLKTSADQWINSYVAGVVAEINEGL